MFVWRWVKRGHRFGLAALAESVSWCAVPVPRLQIPSWLPWLPRIFVVHVCAKRRGFGFWSRSLFGPKICEETSWIPRAIPSSILAALGPPQPQKLLFYLRKTIVFEDLPFAAGEPPRAILDPKMPPNLASKSEKTIKNKVNNLTKNH